MAENKTRRVFCNINGLTGGVIATLLLLAILAYLTMWAIQVQQENAETYYKIENPAGLKFNSTENAKHYKLVK